MSGHLFILGNTPLLAIAELSVFYPHVRLIAPHVALVMDDIVAPDVIARLGGTVKIAAVIAQAERVDADVIVKTLQEHAETNFTFGISSYTTDLLVTHGLLDAVKRELHALGKHVRFVEGKHGAELSSVLVKKQAVTELVVVKDEKGWMIGQTFVVQDFEQWANRDFGRPAADPKAGMLPPKVARMAVNLAFEPRTTNHEPRVLLDPFCGMGTVLGEALLTGWNVVGSDLSAEVVDKAKKNIEWLEGSDTSKKYPILPAVKLFVSDATHVSEKIESASIDVIVTEPFMGPAHLGANDQYPISNDQLKNTVKGLEKLYIGCLKDWRIVLKPGGLVVMALPKYSVHGREFFVKSVIDRCESLGYTILRGPIEYSRPQAVVRREFFVLQKINPF